MCETCGCGRKTVELGRSLLAHNDAAAQALRLHFASLGAVVLNVMGSPGSGKTALLEATRRVLPDLPLAAVSGDLATTLDADRLARAGIRAQAITTGTGCHLEAGMVRRAVDTLGLAAGELFFIENVGNLVCPAVYDLGQTANVVVLSVTEGVDKPLKYPVMFEHADLVVLSKIDLLPYLPDVDLARFEAGLRRVMPVPRFVAVSATSGAGLDAWAAWVREVRRKPGLTFSG